METNKVAKCEALLLLLLNEGQSLFSTPALPALLHKEFRKRNQCFDAVRRPLWGEKAMHA
jgi:hypothetical protein